MTRPIPTSRSLPRGGDVLSATASPFAISERNRSRYMATIPTDKLKAAETALTQIERQFGKGSLMRLRAKEFAPISSISTGSIGVDPALRVGGRPPGPIVQTYCPETSGKTTPPLQRIPSAP